METTFIYELIGYIASALVAVSLMMSKVVKLRIVNLIGSATFTLYGILIGSIPVAGMNAFIVFVNIYYLWKIYTASEYFELLDLPPDSKYLHAFIDYYREQIRDFQPKFSEKTGEDDLNLFVLRDMVPAGLLTGKRSGDGRLDVTIDFVLPEYRDFKVGRFLFDEKTDFFKKNGITQIVAAPGNSEHNEYLEEMGFVQDENRYRLLIRG